MSNINQLNNATWEALFSTPPTPSPSFATTTAPTPSAPVFTQPPPPGFGLGNVLTSMGINITSAKPPTNPNSNSNPNPNPFTSLGIKITTPTNKNKNPTNNKQPPPSQKKSSDLSIYSYGDSQAEVLDYVFHNDSRYVTWNDRRVGWRSGWSARGLYQEANVQRILLPISQCRNKNALVLLTFGSTDIDINLPYKRQQKEESDLDTNTFIHQMVHNLWNLVVRLRDMNNDPNVATNINVCLVFPYVPLPSTDEYWFQIFGNNPAAHSERVTLYQYFIDQIVAKSQTEPNIDIIEIGSTTTPSTTGTTNGGSKSNSNSNFVVTLLNIKQEFDRASSSTILFGGKHPMCRKEMNHHPNYIATQSIIADKLIDLSKIIGVNINPTLTLTQLYPHEERDIYKHSKIIAKKKYYKGTTEGTTEGTAMDVDVEDVKKEDAKKKTTSHSVHTTFDSEDDSGEDEIC